MNDHIVANLFIFYKLVPLHLKWPLFPGCCSGSISSAVSLHVEVEGTFLLPFEIEGKFPLPFEVVGKFPLPFEIEGKLPLLVKGKVTPEVDGTLRVDALQEAVERPHQEVSPFYRADSSLSVLKFLDTPLIFVQYTIQETH